MKYLPIDKQLFIDNRQRFDALLKPKSIAIFNSNDIMPTSADGARTFVQHSDIFYLSGIDQEESILLCFPDAPNPEHREILFLKETNEHIAIWEGAKYSKKQAQDVSGIQTIFWIQDFESVLRSLVFDAEYIYLNTNEHSRAVVEVQTRDARFINECKANYPLHKYERVAPLMHHLRAIKNETEIALLQTACDITNKGFRRVLNFVKDGVAEYEIEAEYIHEFIRNRSKGFSYEPIIASGKSACVLHYIENNKICKDGEVILMDVGAEYANYAADMTRSIPVSGRFTKRQREVYDAVLRVQRASLNLLTPSYTINEYHKLVGGIMEKELVDLNLITLDDIKNQDPKNPAYKKYFMHGTSHHLGIDVHDYGRFDRKIEEGMVFTCEPGIYILEEGLGIRLENDVVITKDGYHDLMRDIPIDAEEIEDLMNK
jgi:Xaa-Pro aminopeptidase